VAVTRRHLTEPEGTRRIQKAPERAGSWQRAGGRRPLENKTGAAQIVVYYRSALRGPSSLHFFFKSSARETGRYRSGGEGEACVRWVWGGGRRHRGGHTRNPRGAMGGGGQTQTYHLKPIKHCPLKANASCLIFPLHQGKMSSAQPLSAEWPRLPLTRESRATNEQTALPQPLFYFPLYNRKSNARASLLSHLWPLFAVA
jgi:hypothetical protein